MATKKAPSKKSQSAPKKTPKPVAKKSVAKAKSDSPSKDSGKKTLEVPKKLTGPLSKLGKKFTCYSCGTKFYDLNKPDKICPKCGADQFAKPAMKSKREFLKSQEFEIEETVTPGEEEFIDEDLETEPAEREEEEEENEEE